MVFEVANEATMDGRRGDFLCGTHAFLSGLMPWSQAKGILKGQAHFN